MRLDRNVNAEDQHNGKYAILKLRRVRDLQETLTEEGKMRLAAAFDFLEAAGILDWGETPETEFFVMRIKDVDARPALFVYASGAAVRGDKEYANDIFALAHRAGKKSPHCKIPD